jgi:hypothetical protein
MATVSGRLLAVTLATAGLAACSLFVPLDGYDSEPADASMANDASAGDGGDATTESAAPVTDAGSPSAYALAVLSDQPLLYVRLDDPDGSTTPTQTFPADGTRDAIAGGVYRPDAVRFGFPGAIVGDPDTAVYLNGQLGLQQNAISLSDDVRYSFQGNTSYSVEVWALPDAAQILDGGFGRFWSRDEGFDASRQAFTAGVSGTRFFTERITSGDESHSLYQASALLDAAAALSWTHVVVTYDAASSTLSLYIDGALFDHVVTNGGSLDFLQATELVLGGEPGTDAVDDMPTVYIGALDEFALYKQPLDPSKILRHYQIGMGLPVADEGDDDAAADVDANDGSQP